MDSLERFRNVERQHLVAGYGWVNDTDFTALFAVAEEQQKDIEGLKKAVRECAEENDQVYERLDTAGKKLSAMEEVVEAATRCAERLMEKDYCYVCVSKFNHHRSLPDGSPCPVGIVLSFTKDREAGR